MSKKRHNKTFGSLIFYVMLGITIGALIIGLSSCNTTKQSDRHFYKAMRLSQTETGKNCSAAFPPITGTKDSFIYIQGEDRITHDTIQGNEYLVVGDTVIKYKYITKTIKSIDTVYKTKEVEKVDKGQVAFLQAEKEKNIATIAKQKKALSISLWAIIILGTFTLGRWVLRIWNIKLP